ncbi:SoxR reducing system RseC family protein [Ferrimonas senticii]|uniref:SoxR reducing system RseC family protein n=1 Tax=Ferrimonas senticii TaxID=394566 RepID=UPI0003FB3966|nr:SoxR reducing system RseC family protein [Ferrimonas senticii]
MIEAIATVEACDGHQVTISWVSQSACGHCEQSDDCGTGVVAKAFAPKQNRLTLPCEQTYAVGTQLRVGITEQTLLAVSAMVYLLPLLSAILLALLAHTLIALEPTTITAFVVGGFGGWRMAKYWSAKQAKPLQILGQLGAAVPCNGSH